MRNSVIEKKRTMKGWQGSQEIFFKMVDLSLVGIFVNYLMESQLSTKFASFLLLSNRSVKQRLYIFSVILSNKNKQQLYKIQKRPTSLFYHVLLIKQNECIFIAILENWWLYKNHSYFNWPLKMGKKEELKTS